MAYFACEGVLRGREGERVEARESRRADTSTGYLIHFSNAVVGNKLFWIFSVSAI